MARAVALIGVLVLAPAVASAQQRCTTSDARHVVNLIYSHVLERAADRGSDTHVRQLQNGNATVRDVVAAIVKSSEHERRFISRDDRETSIRHLYRHILGREADASGLQAHAEALATQGGGAVIDYMLYSPEYEEKYGDNGVPGSAGVRYCRAERSDDNLFSGGGVRSGARRQPSAAADARDELFDESAVEWSNAGFDTIDHNRDGRISEVEWLYGYEAFTRVDRNRDGVLSRAEFVAADGANAGSRFEELDANRDGRLTAGEWRGSRRSFDRQDSNGDGVITRREFGGGPVGTTGR